MPTTPFDTYVPDMLMPYMDPEKARLTVIAFVPAGAGLTYTLAKGTVLGQVTIGGRWQAYVGAATDGSEVARRVLQYGVTVDDAGKVTISGNSTRQELGAPAYYHLVCKTTDLVGLDAGAITDLGGTLIEGTLADGILDF